MENREDVCLEVKVERLWRSGLSADEIARRVGLQPVWVEELISMLPEEEPGESGS